MKEDQEYINKIEKMNSEQTKAIIEKGGPQAIRLLTYLTSEERWIESLSPREKLERQCRKDEMQLFRDLKKQGKFIQADKVAKYILGGIK